MVFTPSPRYPDPRVRTLDPSFARYVVGNAAVEQIADGGRWFEGPVWFGDQAALLWSDIPNNRVLRFDVESGAVTEFHQDANFSNGHTRDKTGRLISCEHQTRRVTRTEYDGTITVLASHFNGKRLNSPNDVVVTPDGAIWFTDPTFGISTHYEGGVETPELPGQVYRVHPDTLEVTAVVTDMSQPNGLAFSPDASTLYVVESGSPHGIRAYSVSDDLTAVSDGAVFVDAGEDGADGFRIDTDGNLWCGWAGGDTNGVSGDGVRVFNPAGLLIGAIDLPERCANLVFGGRARNRLFMTASTSVYSLYVNAQGLPY